MSAFMQYSCCTPRMFKKSKKTTSAVEPVLDSTTDDDLKDDILKFSMTQNMEYKLIRFIVEKNIKSVLII